jgi:hypothetical protein
MGFILTEEFGDVYHFSDLDAVERQRHDNWWEVMGADQSA